MANDKKQKTNLANQVNKVLKRRNSSSSESELSVLQLKMKCKQIKNENRNLKSGELNNLSPNKENENLPRAEKPSSSFIQKPPSSIPTHKNQKQRIYDKPSSSIVKYQKPGNNEKSSSHLIKNQMTQNDEKPCSSVSIKNQMPQNKEIKIAPRSLSPKRDNSISNEEDVSEGEEISTKDSGDDELYGEHFEKDMVNIGRNIFCRKKVLDMAIVTSHFATHISRKLLEGVFTWSTLLKSTLTGKSPRAQGRERQMEPVQPLNFEARMAIIEYSMSKAEERNFKKQSIEVVEKAMSQRLGEIKRLHKRGLLHMY